MIDIVKIQGVKSIVYKTYFRFLMIAVLAIAIFALSGCPGNDPGNSGTTEGSVDPNETAAVVNGKAIKLEAVERGIRQQGQGQEAKFSPLELAAARLQVLQGLIQNEVLFQKAEQEKTIPTDEEVTTELNKIKQGSGKSAELFVKELEKVGETEDTFREALKKELAITKLIDNITGKVEPPKDNEIEAFFNSNPESFKNKRGAQLAAIVITPQATVEGDTTTDEVSAQQKAKEVGDRILRGTDFATVAREASEEPNTRLSGGEWRYFSEEEMKQSFGAGFADFVMNKMQNGQIVPQAIPLDGNLLIIKLQNKQEKDEDLSLESPTVRERITKYLTDQRKELLKQSFAAVAMNDAKIENYLAKKVVDNPNELSGARPANVQVPDANANTNANTDIMNSNIESNANSTNKTPPAEANKAEENKAKEENKNTK